MSTDGQSATGSATTAPATAPATAPVDGLSGLLLAAVLQTADAQLVIVLDQDLRIQQISAGALALLGWTPAQVQGKAFHELLVTDPSPGDRPAQELSHSTTPSLSLKGFAAAPQTPLVGRVRLATRDGFARTARLTSSTVHDKAGGVIATVVIATDTSMSSTLERRRAACEEQFRLAFEKSPTALALISLAPATLGRVRRANTAFEAFTGRELTELLSMSVRQLLHPDEVPAHLAYLHLAAQTGKCEPAGVERRFVHADGSLRWARKNTAVVPPSVSSISSVPGSGSTDPLETCLLVQLAETTAQRAATEALAHAALHDPPDGIGQSCPAR